MSESNTSEPSLKPSISTDIQNPELWQFPMDYPLHIIGLAGDDLRRSVQSILLRHFPQFDISTLEVQPSSGGKYHSVRATVPLESHAQVNQLYADLAASPAIRTVV